MLTLSFVLLVFLAAILVMVLNQRNELVENQRNVVDFVFEQGLVNGLYKLVLAVLLSFRR